MTLFQVRGSSEDIFKAGLFYFTIILYPQQNPNHGLYDEPMIVLMIVIDSQMAGCMHSVGWMD